MSFRFVGVYWIDRKEKLPEDGVMVAFHFKGNSPNRIRFGGYSEALNQFWDEVKNEWYDQKRVDYWMPIPVLPEKEKNG